MQRTFVFALPPYDPTSNGVHILYKLARMFAEAGHTVLATSHNNAQSHKGVLLASNDSKEIPFINISKIQFDWIPVFSDSSLPSFTEQINTRFRIWYLLNNPYAMTGDGCLYRPEDLVVSYSKGFSNLYPSFFFNREQPELLAHWEKAIPQSNKKHRIGFYIGKCISNEVPDCVKTLAAKYNASIVTLNRVLPEKKEQLWRLISSFRLLVSTDPVTNLNYESTLLGTPCYVADNYTNTDYSSYELAYPGVFTDANLLEDFYLNGITVSDQKLIRETFLTTTSNHTTVANDFLLHVEKHIGDLEAMKTDPPAASYLDEINRLRMENDRLRHENLQAASPLEPDLKAGFSLRLFLSLGARLRYLALRLEALIILVALRLTTNAQVASECFHKIESYRTRSERREARLTQINQMRTKKP